MIRLTLLTIFVSYFCVTAFKDWFRSLCALIVLIAVVEHPDMPKSMLGIQGLNPWNILMLFVFAGWFCARKREGSTLTMPSGIRVLVVIYVSLVFIATFRLLGSYDDYVRWTAMMEDEDIDSKMSLISEHIVNAVKWLVPGYLLYKGCNTRERMYWATGSILMVFVLLGIQVIRWMPLGNLAGGDDLSERSLKVLVNEIGFHRVNLSMLLAGGSWAVFCTRLWFKKKSQVGLVILGSLALLLAVALTGGRTGYVTWAFVGMMLAFVKWKKYIVLAPIPVLVLYMILPSAFDRLSQGVGDSTNIQIDDRLRQELMLTEAQLVMYSVTSGRNIAWPFVMEKIEERPWLGYGRQAMKTTGVSAHLWTQYSESFPHPHNLYLEFIMENGIIGFFPVILLFLIMLKRSYWLLKEKDNIDYQVVGGVCFSLMLAFMFAGIGSQTFYPREGAVGMWCAIALVMRLWVQRAGNVSEAAFIENGQSEQVMKVDPVWGTKY